jgi:hypothetical protein
MSKYIYEGPSDFFIYEKTKLKAFGNAEMLPDDVVARYMASGHIFKKVADVAPKVEAK